MTITINATVHESICGKIFTGELEKVMYTDFASYESTDDFIDFMVKFFRQSGSRMITFDKYFRIYRAFDGEPIKCIKWESAYSVDEIVIGEKLNRATAKSYIKYAIARNEERNFNIA